MIVFFAGGRLGNQIFQYVFLKTIQKDNEILVVSGFEDLTEVFKIDDFIVINQNNRWMRGLLKKLINIVLIFLSDMRIVSSISQNYEKILRDFQRGSTTYTEKNGVFSFFTFVKLGFFHSDKFFDEKIANNLIIRDQYLKKSDELLKLVPKNSHKIFVHIRRGDYKSYKVYGQSALLPMNYYKNQIEWFIQNKKNPFFIFLSDEPDFIEEEFRYCENKIISCNNHSGTDMAIMTKCNSAILSPSSFGWWGSYLMKERDTVVAPKYWLGFNSEIEYPAGGAHPFMKEIKINTT
ncbi:MAG: alpha-1,2-fucosyltransferase [Deltaproteobacteria bacterium]|nr:alpha-1,2-fucosyltransferase [Deltaproteobacteria bacterium]